MEHSTMAMQSSQNLLEPVRMAMSFIKGWFNIFPKIVRYILSRFVPQCRMLPVERVTEHEQLFSVYQDSASRQPSSLDEYLMSQSHLMPESREPKIMPEQSPQCDITLKRKLQPVRNCSSEQIFGPYTKELLFGRQQSKFRQSRSSDYQLDVDDGNTFEKMKSDSREYTAKSLKNLIDQLDYSASLDKMPCSDEKLSLDEKLRLNVTPSSEPCCTIKTHSKRKPAVINLRNCNLRVVKEVVRKLGMRDTTANTRDWDVCWTANPISVIRCKTFMNHQRTNHFPESSRPLLKNNLAKYLTKMSSKYPNEYDFFPETWCLPEESMYLEGHARKHPNEWFIVKPHNCSSGHGIFITKDLKELANCGKMVCQVYIQRPLLMDGYKFDLRIYVLVTSCKPLRIFVYNEGLVRLSTEPYQSPSRHNEKNRRMHLTNYSLNKYSPKCVIDDEKGTLRKMSVFNGWLVQRNVDVKSVTDSIDDIIIKTTIAIAPVLSHYYYMSFPDQTESNSCFQIFGFDVMLDEDFKPYVLEVNTDPSLYTDIQMERELKEELVLDTFNILNLTKKPKRTVWLNRPKLQGEKLIDDRKLTQSRIEWENSHLGNYRKVYPNHNVGYYQDFLKSAEQIAMSV